MRALVQRAQNTVHVDTDSEGVMISELAGLDGDDPEIVSVGWENVPALIKALQDALAERSATAPSAA